MCYWRILHATTLSWVKEWVHNWQELGAGDIPDIINRRRRIWFWNSLASVLLLYIMVTGWVSSTEHSLTSTLFKSPGTVVCFFWLLKSSHILHVLPELAHACLSYPYPVHFYIGNSLISMGLNSLLIDEKWSARASAAWLSSKLFSTNSGISKVAFEDSNGLFPSFLIAE